MDHHLQFQSHMVKDANRAIIPQRDCALCQVLHGTEKRKVDFFFLERCSESQYFLSPWIIFKILIILVGPSSQTLINIGLALGNRKKVICDNVIEKGMCLK